MQEYIDFIGNNPFIFIGFAVVLGLIIKLEISRATRKFKQVNTNEAVLVMNKDNAVILDVREDKEVQGGIIQGARHITLSNLKERMGQLGSDKQAPVLVYCRSGNRSSTACNMLTREGFENVSNLQGGILAWEAANLPLAKR